MKQILTIFAFICLNVGTQANETTLMNAISNANTAEEKGLAIAKMSDYLNGGWQDQQAKMTMVLRNRQGQETTRKVRNKTMEVEGDGDKAISIFDTPRDVKGTAVLTWSHSLKPDHQWIYLPALKRVKRISSKNKSGPFMGSEFAYEDIASQEVEKYTYLYLRNEKCAELLPCYVIERRPAYEHSGYTRQIVWLDKTYFNPQKIVFYDRKDSELKTLLFKKYQRYLGKYWRSNEMAMQNVQTGKSTRLLWQEYEFGKGFTDRDFDKSTLKRNR